MTDRDIMQQALDALWTSANPKAEAAIAALNERLAQPEQPAPVQQAPQPKHCDPSSNIFKLAEMILSDCGFSSNYQPLLNRVAQRIQGYIDTPPAAQPSTEESSAVQPEQEPVGQLLEETYGRGQIMWFNKPKDQSMLYTTPPQRKPPQFPTMLRKMWSGAEVQKWINENWEQS